MNPNYPPNMYQNQPPSGSYPPNGYPPQPGYNTQSGFPPSGNPPPVSLLPYHVHPLTDAHSSNKICDLCGININGSSKQCPSCRIFICLNCAHIIVSNSEIIKNYHPHPLKLVKEQNWTCNVCRMFKGGFLGFNCKSCCYNVCIPCLLKMPQPSPGMQPPSQTRQPSSYQPGMQPPPYQPGMQPPPYQPGMQPPPYQPGMQPPPYQPGMQPPPYQPGMQPPPYQPGMQPPPYQPGMQPPPYQPGMQQRSQGFTSV